MFDPLLLTAVFLLTLLAAGSMLVLLRRRSRLRISRQSASYLRAVGAAERPATKPQPRVVAPSRLAEPMPEPKPAPLPEAVVPEPPPEAVLPEPTLSAPVAKAPQIQPAEFEQAEGGDSLFDAPERAVPVREGPPVKRKPAKAPKRPKSVAATSPFRIEFSGLKRAINRRVALPKAYERGLVMLYTPPEKVAPSATPEFLFPWFIAQLRGNPNAPSFGELSQAEIRIVELLYNSVSAGDRAYAQLREGSNPQEREILDETRPLMTGNASAVLQHIRNQDGLNGRMRKLVVR